MVLSGGSKRMSKDARGGVGGDLGDEILAATASTRSG
jgi:hypothetical protein